MPIYENGNFDKRLLPVWVKKDQRELIEGALALGWKLHISSDDSLTIISYDERKKYHFSASGRTSNSPRRIKRDLVRFAHPDRLLEARKKADAARDEGADPDSSLEFYIPTDSADIVDHRPELEAERKKVEEQRAARRSSESEPSIVRTQPMMAKASEGMGYQSRVAIERHWSDGSIDYKCVDCNYTSKNRLSVRGHRQTHGRTSERPSLQRTEVPNAAIYKPRRSRIEALANVLREIGPDGDPLLIAEKALRWVHEQSRQATQHAAEREPMTDEEIVTRIRALLDDGSAEQAIREKDEQIEVLQGQLEKLNSRVEELESFIELASTLRRRDSA